MDNHIELAELCLANGVDYLASVWNEDAFSTYKLHAIRKDWLW